LPDAAGFISKALDQESYRPSETGHMAKIERLQGITASVDVEAGGV
jgi:hypothetical protein